MKKQYMKILFVSAFTALFLFGCTKDVDYDDTPEPTDVRLLVANEGQYGAGTASLTSVTYDGSVQQDLFRGANNRSIGDVAQSITRIRNNYYVTLNNSQKIEVFDVETYKSVETIKTDPARIPTYMVHLGGDSMALSDKGTGLLTIVDINHDKTTRKPIRRSIKIGSGNQMIVTDGKLFVAGSSLRAFTLGNITVEGMRLLKNSDSKSLNVVGDSKIAKDKNGNLWVLSSDRLVCINPKSESIIKEIKFPGMKLDFFGARMDISPKGDVIYFNPIRGTEKGVMAVSIEANAIPDAYLFNFPADMNILYNMAVSPQETIFVCDVLFGSLARGKVHEFSLKGEVLATYEAGIFPQYIYFVK